MTGLGSTVYQNHNGEVRQWTVEDAVRGTKEDPAELPGDEQEAYWYLILRLDDPGVRAVVREGSLRTRLRDDDCGTWSVFNPEARGGYVVEAEPDDPYGPLQAQVSPTSPTDLQFEQIQGEGSRKTVNQFLSHPALISHGLGDVQFWTEAFVARSPHDDSIVGCVVLHRPAARSLDDGSRVEVRRLACRADRPQNTASWLLGQVRTAVQDDYDVIQAYSGFAGNRGVCYDAAGFDVAKEEVVDPDNTGWNDGADRDGRVEVQGSWTRRRWEYEL
jgi:hypothetical protein